MTEAHEYRCRLIGDECDPLGIAAETPEQAAEGFAKRAFKEWAWEYPQDFPMRVGVMVGDDWEEFTVEIDPIPRFHAVAKVPAGVQL